MSTAVRLEADLTHLRGLYTTNYRREVQRYPFGVGTLGFLTVADEESTQEVWLVDLSVKGIGFYSDWPLDRGTCLTLELTGHSGVCLTLAARVVHATRRSQGDWLIGCEFAERLLPETLEKVL